MSNTHERPAPAPSVPTPNQTVSERAGIQQECAFLRAWDCSYCILPVLSVPGAGPIIRLCISHSQKQIPCSGSAADQDTPEAPPGEAWLRVFGGVVLLKLKGWGGHCDAHVGSRRVRELYPASEIMLSQDEHKDIRHLLLTQNYLRVLDDLFTSLEIFHTAH
ncbi:hypothetical protein BDN72DRAFT_896476 [Pluteus cervinus]|uniref:Uncharacterized protein n=1 Tax=Pluteus cervinus TaxID=181527 RepID=A0ACD3AYA3_9AGAR|nr:hypothetical protein BDN72DRAFT_896476 [Pluteus cervinus]